MTPQESKDFIESLTPEQQKKARGMIKACIESEQGFMKNIFHPDAGMFRHRKVAAEAFRSLTEET